MEKKLAIKGHPTRGKEVIEILEMLGGKISHECGYKDGFDSSYLFFINTDENFSIDGLAYNSEELKNYYIFTLEEFLEKFPYKVGDRVLYYGNPVFITQIEWIASSVSYHFYYNGKELMLPSKHLQPYKEEKMEDIIKIDIPKGYEFAGVDDDNQQVQVVFEKIGCQYPKTYEECCEILSIPTYYKLRYYTYEHGYNEYTTLNKLCSLQDKLNILGKLLICRDAYWKIYGDKMGLGKPWEPDWNTNELKYIIYYENNKLWFNDEISRNTILAFPTEEIRDTFYKNFEKDIEICKEFL